MIKPLYNNVLLKKVEASNQTESGIIISQKEKNEEYAVVEAVSECKEVKIDDKVYEMPLKKGDKVITVGGIYGEIADVDEKTVLIKVDGDVKLRVDKQGLVKDYSETAQK